MGIGIVNNGITKLESDAIVNAANEYLAEGGGVCGAIFREAGSKELTEACRAIGGCKTGNAVITSGFKLPAKYIIHAVGPRWQGGNHHEAQLLYSAYKQSLILAKENNCHSISFPLISAGIFGYPVEKAWKKAIQACQDFLDENREYDMLIAFAVLDDKIGDIGYHIMRGLGIDIVDTDGKNDYGIIPMAGVGYPTDFPMKSTTKKKVKILQNDKFRSMSPEALEEWGNQHSPSKQVLPNIQPGKYRHYKGNLYELIGVAYHSESLEPMVVYKALYGTGDLWVRPAYMWDEVVEVDGKKVRKFEKVD